MGVLPPADKLKKTTKMRKTFRIGLGIALVIIGFIGGFIPILQGWLFMIPGLIILSEYFPPVKKLLNWAKKRARKAGINIGHADEDKQADEDTPRSEPPAG
jgi:purine-cytosine permease-like protein